MSDAPILERVRADGAAAKIADEPRGAFDAAFVVERVERAAALRRRDTAGALAAWDEAGARHDPATLDEAMQRLRSGAWLSALGLRRRPSLRDAARAALVATRRVGTIELAAAVLGEFGGKDDVDALETLARHPAFTLHAATALSNLDHWTARAALLRLLRATDGAKRVVVIDRLLPHIREAAVRLALVRDALVGLAPEHAREVAGDIAAMCMVREILDDPRAPDDLKAGARLVMEHAADGSADAGRAAE